MPILVAQYVVNLAESAPKGQGDEDTDAVEPLVSPPNPS